MVGGSEEELFHRSARTPGDAVLTVSEFEPGAASFELRRGEVLGIAGLVGSGRTRLLRALFGLAPVKAGRVRIGVYSGGADPHARWRQGMGMLSEDRKAEGLALALSVADNMTVTHLAPLGAWGFVRPDRQRDAARRWIERLGVRCADVGQPAVELSGGNQQKVALARLLHHDVDVLVLDEPTRGIDVGSKAQIYRVVDSLVTSAQPPKAVLMVSSYLPELLGLCDRIAVMRRGRLGEARRAASLTEHDLMMAATGGASAA
jgi:ribose transport system ATP-binding protein